MVNTNIQFYTQFMKKNMVFKMNFQRIKLA